MSVNLMSAIFQTEFFDLKDDEGNVTKASTAKLVLLAMADHANDEGEGAYPSVEKLCLKTALSEQTIRNTFDALRYNGIIMLVGKSKYMTNNHTINTSCFPKAIGKEKVILKVYSLDPLMSNFEGSNESLFTPHPLDPNHTNTSVKQAIASKLSVQNQIVAGVKKIEIPESAKILKALQEHFKLTPNFDTGKFNKQWMEWAIQEGVTAEQIAIAADRWGRDKSFNWAHPNLKGIQENWLRLIENKNTKDTGHDL